MQLRIPLALLLASLTTQAWSLDRDEINKLISDKRYQEALSQINTRLSTTPSDVDALFLQALTFTQQGRHKEAISIYKKVIDINPALPEPRNNLAVLYAQQGEYQTAEKSLQSALGTDPSYATAHTNLSDLYKTLASIAYNKALSLDNGKQPSAIPEPKLRLLDKLHSYQPASIKIAAVAGEPPKKPAALPPAPPPTENRPPVALNTIEESIMTWAKAWAQQNTDNYLGSYSSTFIPPDNLSRAEWNEQRRERVKGPGFIKVAIDQLEIQPLSEQIASVTFRQRYQSDRFTEVTRKLLLLRQEQGIWRIVQEAETK